MVTPQTPDEDEWWWEAKVPFAQTIIDVVFMLPVGVRTLSALIAPASAFVRDLPRHDKAARSYATEQLLTLWNSEWRPDEEPPLSGEEFVSGITLKSVGIFGDGSVELRYGSTAAFADRLIYVEMSATGTPTDASI